MLLDGADADRMPGRGDHPITPLHHGGDAPIAQENDSHHHGPEEEDDDADALPEPDPRRRQVRSHPGSVRGRQGAECEEDHDRGDRIDAEPHSEGRSPECQSCKHQCNRHPGENQVSGVRERPPSDGENLALVHRGKRPCQAEQAVREQHPAGIRSVRFPLADAHTPKANAIMSASYSEPSTIQSGLVETPHADSSLGVWEIGLTPRAITQIMAP